jgi:hypothetical protein
MTGVVKVIARDRALGAQERERT